MRQETNFSTIETQVLSADVANKHGYNTHGVIFDELHTQPNRKLYDVMMQDSGDARMQPLYFLITAAGNDTNSICYEIHQKTLDIQAGRKIDPTFYSVIYGADESEDSTEANVVHYGYIETFIESLGERFNIREIAFDRWSSADGSKPERHGIYGSSIWTRV